jgi:sensor histidine kinase YesM
MIAKINLVYQSNVTLNALSDAIAGVQGTMKEYLDTKSSEAIDSYYRSAQELEILLLNLNENSTDNEMLLMEKNIRYMSESYLEITNDTVQAKRGRNIEKYRNNYEEASKLFTTINMFMYSLNNEQFKDNSNNYEAFATTLKSLETVSMTLLIIVTVINIGLLYILTRRITDPLIGLAKAANEVAKGNLQIGLVEVGVMDEVGIVSKAFNKMVYSIKVYIDKIRENMELENTMKEKELIMEGHLKDAQLKYLQAQINPHFLFNTLNAGAQLAMMESADKTSLFIENMADFFRYNLKNINQVASIEEELNLVDNYIHIINVRFVGEIHFQKSIEDEWLSVNIPRMILQPIVENAVNYGIRNIDWNGTILLSVYKCGEYICISIKDNGIGMSQDKIDKILLGEIQETDVTKNSNGIGLGNVINRLKLYYDEEDLFEIKSYGENKGTEVIIYIPLKLNSTTKEIFHV